MRPKPSRGLLVVVVPTSACLFVVGCGGSGGTTASGSTSRPLDPGCKKPGIRYAGRTASGVKVCFTLSPDGKTWREIGYLFVRKQGCPGTQIGVYRQTPQEGSGPGQIIFSDFAAKIHGVRASGFIEDENFCEGKRFAWSARRLSP